jgi:ribosomal protein S18 acetylase RimI-like enzyme
MIEINGAAVALRPERETDRAFLRALHAALPAHEGVPDAVVDQQFELQSRHYRASFPNAEYWIVEDAGLAVGRLYLQAGESGIRVLDIALVPDARGRGLGDLLLRGVLNRARAGGTRVTLDVEAANPARRLYARLGFREVLADGPKVSMVWER